MSRYLICYDMLMTKKFEIDKKKIKVALELLGEETTTIGKIEKVLAMLPGINPKVDKIIADSHEIIEKINKISEGAVLELSAEKLPDKTKIQKQRKKLILLLLTNWKSLGGEIGRINSLVSTAGTTATTSVKTAKILATMKGPLGVVTIGAAAIVLGSKLLNNMAVEVKVTTNGCRPIGPISEKGINLPGLKMPKEAIVSGRESKIVIPPVKMTVNLNRTNSSVTAVGFKKDFSLPPDFSEIIYDGQNLMGKETGIDLAKSKSHSVNIKCN